MSGGSPTPGNGLAGWGARIRTWEWRNQNPQKAFDMQRLSGLMLLNLRRLGRHSIDFAALRLDADRTRHSSGMAALRSCRRLMPGPAFSISTVVARCSAARPMTPCRAAPDIRGDPGRHGGGTRHS